ncbi:MAG: RNA polymerase sigma factor [Planctomycetota bacterium]
MVKIGPFESSRLCIANNIKGITVTEKGFETLLNDYGGQVLNTAMRILGNTQQAQDVHQEVFLDIWRRWHKYNGQTKWSAYLYRTTVRKAIKFARQSRIEPLADRQTEYLTASEKPDDSTKVAELQQKLTACLAKLPQRQANVFVLSRIEGLSHQDIAEMLGCSTATVRVHLHRAMQRLARELGDYLK